MIPDTSPVEAARFNQLTLLNFMDFFDCMC